MLMSWKRMWAMFIARNYEFFRDKAAFGWNFLFPFLIIAGFGIVFGGRDYSGFKVGVFPSPAHCSAFSATGPVSIFSRSRNRAAPTRTRRCSRLACTPKPDLGGVFSLPLPKRLFALQPYPGNFLKPDTLNLSVLPLLKRD